MPGPDMRLVSTSASGQQISRWGDFPGCGGVGLPPYASRRGQSNIGGGQPKSAVYEGYWHEKFREQAEIATAALLRVLSATLRTSRCPSRRRDHRDRPPRCCARAREKGAQAHRRGSGLGACPSVPPAQCLARGHLLPGGQRRFRADFRKRKRHRLFGCTPRANISTTPIFGATAFIRTTSPASMPGSTRCSRATSARSSTASAVTTAPISG